MGFNLLVLLQQKKNKALRIIYVFKIEMQINLPDAQCAVSRAADYVITIVIEATNVIRVSSQHLYLIKKN